MIGQNLNSNKEGPRIAIQVSPGSLVILWILNWIFLQVPIPPSLLFLLFFLYWSIVDLQCCVHFWYIAKWFHYTSLSLSLSIYIYIYIYIHTHIYFQILFHYGLSQDIEYSSLCCTVGPCCLSLLCEVVCICQMSFSISSSLNGTSLSSLFMSHDVSRGHGVSWEEGPREAPGAEGGGSGSHGCQRLVQAPGLRDTPPRSPPGTQVCAGYPVSKL